MRVGNIQKLRALGQVDHFAGVSKMILRHLAGVLTGDLGPFNHRLEVAPLRVAKKYLELSCEPVLHAVSLVRAILEALVQFVDQFPFHR